MNKVVDEGLTFDDVLIVPQYSEINSRSEVDIMVEIPCFKQKFLPIISANMDTITGTEMAKELLRNGALGCLHRFWDRVENTNAYVNASFNEVVDGNFKHVQRACAVSVGVGENELKRAAALYFHGARMFVLDVAHGAQKQVVEQYKKLKELTGSFVVVGNFASSSSVGNFIVALNRKENGHEGEFIPPDGIKIGVGPGSACTTRIKTGVGVPQLSAILDICRMFKYKPIDVIGTYGSRLYDAAQIKKPFIIADGGCKTPGDVAKALAAGADMVMLGGMLAGTAETPGEVIFEPARPMDEVQRMLVMIMEKLDLQSHIPYDGGVLKFKKYRGSASKDSYRAQGKDQGYITAEGESFTVPFKGPVSDIIKDIEGGLRSAFTYVGARNLKEFQDKAHFTKVTSTGLKENGAHGNK